MTQWLGFQAFTAGAWDSIPGQGTETPQDVCCGQKKKKKKETEHRNHFMLRSQIVSVRKNREIYLEKSIMVYEKFSDEFKYFKKYPQHAQKIEEISSNERQTEMYDANQRERTF